MKESMPTVIVVPMLIFAVYYLITIFWPEKKSKVINHPSADLDEAEKKIS